VTFADWDACLAGGGCNAYSPPDQGWGRGRRPVIGVSWEDANGYVQWLNRQAGKEIYRLPTEAEWEYAARAGATTPYASGASLKQGQAVFAAAKTDPVGSYTANAFGAFDMNGNAAEWVDDCYAPSLKAAPVDGAAVTQTSCAQRVYRGGSFADKVAALRSASRAHGAASLRNRMIGFRVVQILE
jgi:formylglycine-generating enzyme required for sulfatase activity